MTHGIIQIHWLQLLHRATQTGHGDDRIARLTLGAGALQSASASGSAVPWRKGIAVLYI